MHHTNEPLVVEQLHQLMELPEANKPENNLLDMADDVAYYWLNVVFIFILSDRC
jgi:hypothetical protein